jgi:hypothetical protein
VSKLSRASASGGLAAGGWRRISAGFRSREVGQQVENILETAKNSVVYRELAVENLLKVRADIAETKVKALERLKLVGNTGG